MNKYEEALDYIFNEYKESNIDGSFLTRHHLDILRELIENHKMLDKTLDAACEYITNISGSCPYDSLDYKTSNCDECKNEHSKCWKEHFLRDIDA